MPHLSDRDEASSAAPGGPISKKLRVLVANTHDPYFNLATEDWIYKDMDLQSKVLFVWRNANTIVIGRGQNAWSECDLELVKADGVQIARRHSGGGAVFQDLGNTCFTFMSAREPGVNPRELYARNNQILIGALARLGVPAEASGRNDLVVRLGEEIFKISGSAFKESPDRCFHHGTMLLNVDLSRLGRYLTPNQKKLQAKGIKSVQSRVMNLVDLVPGLDHDAFAAALIAEFFSYYGSECAIEELDHQTLARIPALDRYYETLRSWDWVFGKTPSFLHKLDHRFSFGMVEICLNTERGHMRDVKLYSDSLDPEFIERVAEQLEGHPYTPEGVRQTAQEHLAGDPSRAAMVEEFYSWLETQL
jgi:lipoate-protein ligase A